MPDPATPPIFIKPFNHSEKIFGASEVCIYLNDYLKEKNAKTVIIENEYIDRDFIIDYSKVYSRSFKNIKKTTTRYHFFDKDITNDEFFSALSSTNSEDLKKKMSDSYLGFIVKKPIENIDRLRSELVGRTLVKTYDRYDGDDERNYIYDTYDVSLCGIPLKVESLPFQQKDVGVGACATIACWVTLFPLSKLFGTSTLSPSEVTEKSVSFPSEHRNFPSKGLTIQQIKTYYNSIGLEMEIINPWELEDDEKNKGRKWHDSVADITKAYTNMKIPIIAGLSLVPKKEITKKFNLLQYDDRYSDQHAVVITGYRHKKRTVNELYIHDDTFGPYCYIEPLKDFKKWICRYEEEGKDSVFVVNRLLIPIYPKIRLDFFFIYGEFAHWRVELEEEIKQKRQPENMDIEFLLFGIKDYKESLLNKKVEFLTESKLEKKITRQSKTDFLVKSLPRFIWVIRYNADGVPKHDRIYDGIDTLPNLIGHIEFS